MEGDVIVLQDLYLFDYGMGIDEDGKFLGRLKSTGIRPHFTERLANNGISLDSSLFARRHLRATRGGSTMIGLVARRSGVLRCPSSRRSLIAVAVFALAMTLLTMDGDRRSELEKRLTGFAGDEIDAELEADRRDRVQPDAGHGVAHGPHGRAHRRARTASRTSSSRPTSRCGRPKRCSSTWRSSIVVVPRRCADLGPLGALIAARARDHRSGAVPRDAAQEAAPQVRDAAPRRAEPALRLDARGLLVRAGPRGGGGGGERTGAP